MTDERMGDALWPALRRLPPGSGVVFRHYATPAAARRALARKVRRVATARRLILVIAGTPVIAADGVHGKARTKGLRTWPAHSRREVDAGARAKADALFISPVYPTHSHKGAPALGPARALKIGRGLKMPVIALGGMTAKRWRRIKHQGYHGWAAIDALTPHEARSNYHFDRRS